jgi:predicted nucleic acid-binding protein
MDASVTLAWCFEDEATEATDAVLDRLHQDHAVVPPIWPLEVANVMLVAGRRGRLTEAQTSRFLALLSQLPIEIDDSAAEMPGLIAAGRRHGLSSYDASYLVLAERLGASLATLDQRLADAAGDAGVPLLVGT